MDALSEVSVRDLVAVIAQRETRHLVERAGGLERLARAEAFEIAAHLDERDPDTRDQGEVVESPSRVTLEAACALAAAFELGRRVELIRSTPPLVLLDDASVIRWAMPRLATLAHEEVWLLAVDCGMNLRAARCIARGGLHGAGIRPADAVRAAMRLDATAFLLVHNHPSGDPTPSPEDEQATVAIAGIAAIVDIPLLDHFVVARGGYQRVSFNLLDEVA